MKGEIFLFNKLKKVISFALVFTALWVNTYASELSSWAKEDYTNASRSQLIPFSVGAKSMGENITREQFCELIVNTYESISGKQIPESSKNPFSDCENQSVINAYGVGLVGGTSENSFSPENFVTRQEMAKMLFNMLVATELDIKFSTAEDTVLNSYGDVDKVSSWARPAMATALNYSLMNGSDGFLLPTENTTCEQAIVAVSRAYNAFSKTENQTIGQVASILAPTENANITQEDVSLLWTSVSGASLYKVLVRNDSGDLIINSETKETNLVLPKTEFDTGLYHVTISACFENGKEVFSIPVSFSYVNLTEQTMLNGGLQSFDAPDKESDIPKSLDDSKISGIFAEGEKHIGTPYRYGGTTPAGFDCSGFVQYVFRANGITLKRTSRDQYKNNGYSVSKSELKRGDLVFFGSGGYVNHVGIYAGDGKMLHSPSTGKTITYTSIETDYYKSHYIGAKRIIE